MIFQLLHGPEAGRPFSSKPRDGDGGASQVAVAVDASVNGAMAWIRDLASSDKVAVFDTVRGASARVRQASLESIVSAFSFSAKNRIFTGSTYNAIGSRYAFWNFARLARFCDIVPFTGAGGSVAHALGETPKFIIVMQRTGATAGTPTCSYWCPGDASFLSPNDQLESAPSHAAPFAPCTSSAMTPDNTAPNPVFATGKTFVAFLFGSGLNISEAVHYTGDGTGARVITTTVPGSWVLLYGLESGKEPFIYDQAVGTALGMEGTVGLSGFSIAGTSLSVPSSRNTLGVEYRALVIR